MLFDTHVHTEVSPDAVLLASDAIQIAKSNGMGVIFTEHHDENGTEGYGGFKVDPDLYLDKYKDLRADDVLIGFEVGVTHKYIESNKAMVNSHDFDYIIGSVHNINNFEIDIDYFNKDDLTSEEKYYTDYLIYTLKVILENDYFDALGHIDYISRYSHYKTKNIEYKKYKSFYDDIFKALLDTNKTLEINTRRLSDKSALAGLYDIYQGFYDMGGRYIPIGSDAHDKSVLFKNFDIAQKLLSDIGLTPVYFKDRKMIIC